MGGKIILLKIVLLLTGITLNAQITNKLDTLKTQGKDFNKSLKLDTVFTNLHLFKGKYFSNNTPEAEPLLFAKGLVNPKLHHIHSAPVFSPDLNEMYFSVYLNNDDPQRIFISKKIDGIWQKPQLANFSGQYQDGRPILSSDGKTLYFYSKRPILKGEDPSENSQIWFVKRKNGKWGKPQLLSFSSSLGTSFYPDDYASNGIFYFSIKIASGDFDIYQCEIKNDKAFNIKRVDEPVCMKKIVDLGAATNPDNSILIFQSNNRNNKNQAILYACKKLENGEWGNSVPLSDKINQSHTTRFASFSKDGKYFFFACSKSGVEEIYWVKSSQLFSTQ
jgi:WD40 repeat protein